MMKETRRVLAMMLECDDIPDSSWAQALLPMGPGLGFVDLVRMAPFMAHASILETVLRLAEMDPSNFRNFSVPEHWQVLRGTQVFENFTSALKAFDRISDSTMHTAQLQQKFAMHVIIPEAIESFMKNKNIPDTAKAIVKTTVDSPLAKHLFTAIPTEDGLVLSSDEMQISVSLLLGVPIQMKWNMCICNPNKQLTMYHALSCKKKGGLIIRHDAVKYVLGEMCKAAQLNYELEPQHMVTGRGLRPDILIQFGKDGRNVSFDLTIYNPLCNEHSMRRCLRDDQDFLNQAATIKIRKYLQDSDKISGSFTPIVLSVFGGILDESCTSGIEYLLDKMRSKYFNSPNWAAPDKKTYLLATAYCHCSLVRQR